MQSKFDHLIERLSADNPRTPAIKSALKAKAAAAAAFAARSNDLISSGNYSESGAKAAVRDLVPAALRAQHVAGQPLRLLKRDIDAKRANLRPADPDKSDLAGALERGEIHLLSRSMKPLEREALYMTTNDVRLLEALVTSPPELSGFTANDRAIVDKIEQRYVELKHPAEVAELESLTALLAEAEAISAVARNELRNVAQMDSRDFESVAAKVESAVWLVGEAGAEQVCEPGPDGLATYRPATPDEVATGQRYASAAEYQAARAA